MEVTVGAPVDGSISIAFTGELDLSSAGRVERELHRIEQRRPGVIALDLRGLTFIDSTGLRLFLEADKRARTDGRRVVIVRGPERVHRVFEIARVDTRLTFVDDPSDAEAAG